MSIFSQTLDLILEEESPLGRNPLEVAQELRSKLEAAKQEVENLENQLKIATQKMNGDLALGIRKNNPALNVGVDDNGCKVGYKTKHMMLTPDVLKGVWSISSPDTRFMNKFTRDYSGGTVLNPNISEIIKSVLGHFTNHFKSLHEDITGTGVIMVENKIGTLSDLMKWRNKHQPAPLMSRRVRRAARGRS